MTISRIEYHGLFTVIIDDRGRSYRVLLATGTPDSRYRLQPWRLDGTAASHDGVWINEGNPLLSEIDQAERARQHRPPAIPVGITSRFASDTI